MFDEALDSVNKSLKESQEGTVDLYGRYIGDGYLAYVAYADDYTGSDRYWPDYYSDEDDSEAETVLLKDVPVDLADKLVNDEFGDGYEAAQAAAPYVVEDEEDFEPNDEVEEGVVPNETDSEETQIKKMNESRFTAYLVTNKGRVLRNDNRNMSVSIKGESVGVTVDAYLDRNGNEIFYITTSGVNGEKNIGYVTKKDGFVLEDTFDRNVPNDEYEEDIPDNAPEEGE